MYACDEFIEHYGPTRGAVEWNRCTQVIHPADAVLDQRVRTIIVQLAERRRARDGHTYMCTDFLWYYGDTWGAWIWYTQPTVFKKETVLICLDDEAVAAAARLFSTANLSGWQ